MMDATSYDVSVFRKPPQQGFRSPFLETDIARFTQRARQLFPFPKDATPTTFKVGSNTTGPMERGKKVGGVSAVITNTWRNPYNHAWQRRGWYMALAPWIDEAEEIWTIRIPNSEIKKRAPSIAKAVKRAGGNYAAMADDFWWTILSDVEVPGSQLVPGNLAALEDALLAIPRDVAILEQMRRQEHEDDAVPFSLDPDNAVSKPQKTPVLRPIRTSTGWSLAAAKRRVEEDRKGEGQGEGGDVAVEDASEIALSVLHLEPETLRKVAEAHGFEVRDRTPFGDGVFWQAGIILPADARGDEAKWRRDRDKMWETLQAIADEENLAYAA